MGYQVYLPGFCVLLLLSALPFTGNSHFPLVSLPFLFSSAFSTSFLVLSPATCSHSRGHRNSDNSLLARSSSTCFSRYISLLYILPRLSFFHASVLTFRALCLTRVLAHIQIRRVCPLFSLILCEQPVTCPLIICFLFINIHTPPRISWLGAGDISCNK